MAMKGKAIRRKLISMGMAVHPSISLTAIKGQAQRSSKRIRRIETLVTVGQYAAIAAVGLFAGYKIGKRRT